jgi:hypothetical protein
MFNWLKKWWEANKKILVAKLLVLLDAAKAPLAEKLKEIEGTPEQQADKIIEWVKEYIKRQI